MNTSCLFICHISDFGHWLSDQSPLLLRAEWFSASPCNFWTQCPGKPIHTLGMKTLCLFIQLAHWTRVRNRVIYSMTQAWLPNWNLLLYLEGVEKRNLIDEMGLLCVSLAPAGSSVQEIIKCPEEESWPWNKEYRLIILGKWPGAGLPKMFCVNSCIFLI